MHGQATNTTPNTPNTPTPHKERERNTKVPIRNPDQSQNLMGETMRLVRLNLNLTKEQVKECFNIATPPFTLTIT